MPLQRRYRYYMSVRKTALVTLLALVVSSAVAVCDCFAAAEHHQHQHADTHEPAKHADCGHDECDDCVTKPYNGRAASELALPRPELALINPDSSPFDSLTDARDPRGKNWQAPPGFALLSAVELHNASPITRADILIE